MPRRYSLLHLSLVLVFIHPSCALSAASENGPILNESSINAVVEPVGQTSKPTRHDPVEFPSYWGERCLQGAAAVQNPHDMIALFENAAYQGLSNAKYCLAMLYVEGIGTAIDKELGEELLRQAAREENEHALSYFRDAAQNGDLEAQVFFAECLAAGTGVKCNVAEALRLLLDAANKGNSTAMLRLGEIYEADEIVPLDVEQSLFWYEKAGNAGVGEAWFQLGELYREGRLVGHDLSAATMWYVKAAISGHARARVFLFDLVDVQPCEPKTYEIAVTWMKQAARQGDVEAQGKLNSLSMRNKK